MDHNIRPQQSQRQSQHSNSKKKARLKRARMKRAQKTTLSQPNLANLKSPASGCCGNNEQRKTTVVVSPVRAKRKRKHRRKSTKKNESDNKVDTQYDIKESHSTGRLQPRKRKRRSSAPTAFDHVYFSSALLVSDEVQHILRLFEERLEALYSRMYHIEYEMKANNRMEKSTIDIRRVATTRSRIARCKYIFDDILALMSEHATEIIVHHQALRDDVERTRFQAIEQLRERLVDAGGGLEGMINGFRIRLYALLEELSPESMRKISEGQRKCG